MSWSGRTLPVTLLFSSTMHARTTGHQMGKLVHDWLHAAAEAQVRHTLTLPARLQLVHHLMDLVRPHDAGMTLNWEDVQATLTRARGVWLGRAQAAGPERASLMAKQIWESGLQVGPDTGPAQELLLVMRAGREQEVEMAELIAIIESVQLRGGEQCTVVFGCGTDDTLGEHLETLLLVGYG